MSSNDMEFDQLTVPEHYFKMNAAPDDPPYSTPYGSESNGYQAFVLVYPVHVSNAMPFGHPETLVNGIHDQLVENQGLIEVKDGNTKAGRSYIYSIVKTMNDEEKRNQYNLTMHVFYKTYVMNITGFFDEIGMTGMREAQAYIFLTNEGIIAGPEEWCKDPYDEAYTKGHLMNRSEDERFDRAFPEHPLSEARKFAKYIIENN